MSKKFIIHTNGPTGEEQYPIWADNLESAAEYAHSNLTLAGLEVVRIRPSVVHSDLLEG